MGRLHRVDERFGASVGLGWFNGAATMQLSPGLYSRVATILDPTRGMIVGSERRREPRMSVQGVGKVAAPGAPVDSATMVQVQDVSLGGASLLASKDMTVGDQLVLVLKDNAGQAVSLLCSVAHCRQVTTDVYVVGAQFLHAQGTDGTAKGKTVQVAPPKQPEELVAPAPGRERYKQLFNG